jgi:hypothetical protein
MSRLAAVWLAMAGVWFSTTACKSDPPEVESVPVKSFATAFSRAQCDNLERCCSLSKFEFDRVNCEGRQKASLQASLDRVLMGPVDYDERVAGECLATLSEQQGCGVESIELPPCKGMLVGRLQDGEPCSENTACKSGWCTSRGDAVELVCTPLAGSGLVVTGKAGHDCVTTCEAPGNCPAFASSETEVVCYRTDGLFCESSAEAQRPQCQRLLEIGKPCQESQQCELGLFCRSVCQAPHPNGAACEYGDECLSGACVQGECVTSAFDEEACTSGGIGG